jgi:PAS domain-containing protein
MSGGTYRRPRRTGSTARRYTPATITPAESRRPSSGKGIRSAAAAVCVLTALLIALIWIVTSRVVDDQRIEFREGVELNLTAQASALADGVAREVLTIDQGLAILQAAWQRDSETFKLTEWQERLPALTAISEDIFIADDKQIIRQDILPKAVGQGIGTAYMAFDYGTLEAVDANGNRVANTKAAPGQVVQSFDARNYLTYIVRPLHHPEKWSVAALLRSRAVAQIYAHANLGTNCVVAVIDSYVGTLQAIAGPAARRPDTSLTRSVMYDAVRKSDSGTWTGATAMDQVSRIHAFRRVPGREMIALVGVVEREAMAPMERLAGLIHLVAGAASIVTLSAGGLLLWLLFRQAAVARMQNRYQRAESERTALQTDLAAARGRERIASIQLRALLDSAMDGIAILDGDERLVMWNDHFSRMAGQDPGTLKIGLPLDALLRQQARAGLFGLVTDQEAEIARRITAMRAASAQEPLTQRTPAGQTVTLRVTHLADGGMTLALPAATSAAPPPLMPADRDDL